MAGLSPSVPPTSPYVGRDSPIVTGGSNYRDAYNADPRAAASGDYMGYMAQELIGQANTMVGNGIPPDNVFNLGAQAPGMQPGTALSYANGLFRQGVTQGTTVSRRLIGRNLFPGHVAYTICAPCSDIVGNVVDHDAWTETLQTIERGPGRSSHDAYRHEAVANAAIKNIPMRSWNLADLNCELFRRQRTPVDSAGTLKTWDGPDEFLRDNPVRILGAIDTSSNKNVIGSGLVHMTAEPGIKDCDIIPRGYAMSFRHSAFGPVGRQGQKFVAKVVQVPMDYSRQVEMTRLTREYMETSGRLLCSTTLNGAMAIPGRMTFKNSYASSATPYKASEAMSAKRYEQHLQSTKDGVLVPPSKNVVKIWQVVGFTLTDPTEADGVLLDATGTNKSATFVVGTVLNDFLSASGQPEVPDSRGSDPTFFSLARVLHHHDIAMKFFGGQHTDYGSLDGAHIYEPGQDSYVHTLIEASGFIPIVA